MDRLFGTFVAECAEEAPHYGIVKDIETHNTLRFAFREWAAMVCKLAAARSLRGAMGFVGCLAGTLKAPMRGEIKKVSDVCNDTRHHALGRLVSHAIAAKANSVVGVRTSVLHFAGFHEMHRAGTAAVYSLGAIGGIKAAFLGLMMGGLMREGMMRGEIGDLTTLMSGSGGFNLQSTRAVG